jgi:tripartite-type tricarboxylate transporter receptor subunit TctC
MHLVRTLFAMLAAVVSCAAFAQSWPAKPVRIVVAYPPGGGIDVMARQMAERLTAAWG